MISITASHIIEHIYCQGYTWFQYVLGIPQYEEKYYKVLRGREVHAWKEEINREYLRKRIGVKNKLIGYYMSYNRLRGVVDEVLELNDGSYAPLDYKFAEWNDHLYDAIKIQLWCYAYLIEHTFNQPVNRAYIVYIRSKNKLIEETITLEDKKTVEKCIEEILSMVETNQTPTLHRNINKCNHCTYQKICYL